MCNTGSKTIYPDSVDYPLRYTLVVPPMGSGANFVPPPSGKFPTLPQRKCCKALYHNAEVNNLFKVLYGLVSDGVFWGVKRLVSYLVLVCLVCLGRFIFLLV